jgi:hypothetical protein
MSLSYNGTEPQSITWNGADVQSVTMDGVEVWSAHPPFLVRMRYDANEATHVKDLVGGYTITTNTGGAVPAAADPFGGNNALNLNDIYVIYAKNNVIPGDSTVCFWAKLTGGVRNFILSDSSSYSRDACLKDSKLAIVANSTYISAPSAAPNITDWHFYEINSNGNLYRLFVDGILVASGTNSNLTSGNMRYYKRENYNLYIGFYYWDYEYNNNKFRGHIYDFCILDGIWHTENYNVPTAYI